MVTEDASDRFDLVRFVAAQDSGGTYEQAVAELRRGYKSSHWIWFVFPQIAGLGSSGTARRYAIGSADEARAYLAHPVLGPRLAACTELLRAVAGQAPEAVLGPVDAMKVRSSMTLFAAVAEDPAPFRAVLDQWYGGRPDDETTRRL